MFRFPHLAPAGAQFRRAPDGFVRTLGEAAAEYVAGVLHDHEGKGIQIFYQLFDFCHLGQFYDTEQQLPVLVGVGAFPFDIGDAPAYDFDDGFRDFFVMVADDDNILFKVKTVGERVGDFEDDKVGGQGVEGGFQPEEEGPGRKQHDVDEKSGGADTDAVCRESGADTAYRFDEEHVCRVEK